MGNAFTLSETLSLLGLIQSVYILVYMALRSGNWRYALVPMAYFTCLSAAFLMDAASSRWTSLFRNYDICSGMVWMASIPLGTLLIFQVAKSPALPSWKSFSLLLLVPVSVIPLFVPDVEREAVYISGMVTCALALLAVWIRRDLLEKLPLQAEFGQERFWLILSMVVVNAAFLGSTLAFVSGWINAGEWILVRDALGIGFAYIAATSLFRIYPQAVVLSQKTPVGNVLNDEEKGALEALEKLLHTDRVYLEPSYGRAELARELGIGEAVLSRIVNIHYGKTIPQLLNEARVEDARILLTETDVPVSVIYTESGFNSMSTFNRVFKELSGVSPTEYRERYRSGRPL